MLKWVLVGTAALAALAVAAIAALPWFLDTAAMHAYVGQAATHALGRPVKYASLSISAFPLPAVKLKDLQVSEDPAFGPGPFLTVSQGKIRVRLRPLLSGRVELADVTLEEPRISLVEDARGRLNLTTLGAAQGPAPAPPRRGRSGGGAMVNAVVFSSVRVVNGSVRYRRLGGTEAAIALDRMNITLSQPAPGEALTLAGDAVAQPGDVRLIVKDARLTPSGAQPVGEMPLKATVDLEAANVAPIADAFGRSPAVSGAVKGRVEVGGTLAHAIVTGVVNLDRVTLADLRPPCDGSARRQLLVESVRLPLAVGRGQIESAPVTATVAGGNISLRVAVSLEAPAAATLKDVAIKGMELEPVLVNFLCQPYAVTGSLDLSGGASMRPADAWPSLGGTGSLRIGPGKVVGREIVNLVRDVIGLGTTVAELVRPGRPLGRSPLEFDSITATYVISAGVARTDDLVYLARDVKVRAAGTYGLADRRVAMEVTLSQGANRVKGFVSGVPGSLRVVPTGVKLEDTRDIKKFLNRLFR